ncbi:MAG: hypothetical protein CBD58_05185 [bacterium TMED198]|nr:MAG: hypothetical protein CBD58_05185 [bacterium TMED198]
MEYLMSTKNNRFVGFIFLFLFGGAFADTLTEWEKANFHIIHDMGRATDPPPGPVRNIAEYERMQGVVIRYPFGISTSLIKEMAEDVKIYCLVSSSLQNSAYSSMSGAGVNMGNVELVIGSTDSHWTRDYGPWWVVDGNGDVSVVDFTYNRPRPNDNQAPYKMSNHLDAPYFSSDVISTGGNYMTDGLGIAAATHIAYTENNQCNTNDQSSVPLSSCLYVDNIMEDYYGIDTYHVVADPNNEYIDHIDCWGKYLSPHKVLIRSVQSSHPQYAEIEEIADYFSETSTAYGEPWEVFRVYTPSDQPYTNSLILNEKILVPITGSSFDDDALTVYEEAMPGYEVLGFTGSWYSTDALHCRVKGVPDLEMLQIFHNPINDQNEGLGNGYKVDAIIDDLSDSGLVNDELKVFWWTDDTQQSDYMIMNECSEQIPNCYTANIPGQVENSTIKYYIQAIDESGRIEKLPMAGHYSFFAPATITFIDGDVNMDEAVDILDVVLTVNHITGVNYLSGSSLLIGDVNNDGIINILDIVQIINIILNS